jgi:hypothetical protein
MGQLFNSRPLKKPVVYFCGHVSREIKSVKVWLGNIQPVSALVSRHHHRVFESSRI